MTAVTENLMFISLSPQSRSRTNCAIQRSMTKVNDPRSEYFDNRPRSDRPSGHRGRETWREKSDLQH